MNRTVRDAQQAVLRTFLQQYPGEAAGVLGDRPASEIAQVLRSVPATAAAQAIERLPATLAADVLAAFEVDTVRAVVPHMDLRRVAVFLAQLDEAAREACLLDLDRGTAAEIRALMSYPPGSAGSLMDPRVLAVFPRDTSAAEAMRHLRRHGHRRILDLFVVDEDGRLAGTFTLEDLVLADPRTRLDGLYRRPPAAVMSLATREEVVETFERSSLTTLPVVDIDGRLVGVVRYDTLVAAAEAEATASLQTMVGASRDERALSPVSFAVRKRLPWLQVNLGTAFLAAAVVGLFESTIARFTALAVLLPVVAGQSGNTGAQALAVTMRGLTLREIRIRQWLRVVLKEVKVALLTGTAVALTTAIAVFVWSGSFGLTLVIGVSMVVSMVAAALAGAVIPIALTAAGQDPAQSSSIVLTTVTDIVGFFSFLGIATIFAGML
jgi:magnesium transporter